MMPPRRTSNPYVEVVEGPTTVQVGDRVERDDGWWRAVAITWFGIDADSGSWHQVEITWAPTAMAAAADRMGEALG